MQRLNFDDLSNAERAQLASGLMASVSTPELTPEQLAEIDRRIHLMDSGVMGSTPAEAFFAQLDSKRGNASS